MAKQQNRRSKVFGYIRVSTDRQSVENQKYEIMQWATRRGITIDDWVEDVMSGLKNNKYGKFIHLVKKLQEGDTLIVAELSRMSRSLFDIMQVLKTCMEKRVSVYAIKENYELGDNIGSKVLAFAFGLAAEIERNMISMRTKEALARKRAEGVILGRPRGKKSKSLKCERHHDLIVRSLMNGMSYSAIGRLIGVHRLTVSNYVSERGLDEVKSDSKRIENIRKALNIGMDMELIQQQFNLSYNELTNIINSHFEAAANGHSFRRRASVVV